jgi:hypothetical protein
VHSAPENELGLRLLFRECIERSGGEEISSHASPASLTHCVPRRGGPRCVRSRPCGGGGRSDSRDHRLRQTTLGRGPALSQRERHPPPRRQGNLHSSPLLGRLSLKSKWKRRASSPRTRKARTGAPQDSRWPTRREVTNHEAAAAVALEDHRRVSVRDAVAEQILRLAELVTTSATGPRRRNARAGTPRTGWRARGEK